MGHHVITLNRALARNMDIISREKLASWRNKLPADFRSVIPEDFEEESLKACEQAVAILMEAPPNQWKLLLADHHSALDGAGRAARIRLLAALSTKSEEKGVEFFWGLLDEDQGSEGRSSTQVMLLEDIKALNEAIAARMGKKMALNDSLNALRAASLDVAASPEFSGGKL